MGKLTPNPKKRGYLLPPGCKDLIDVLNGPQPKPSFRGNLRVNEQIKALELKVITEHGRHLGILQLSAALEMAKSKGLDLVQITQGIKPPICRLIDYGTFLHQLSERRKRKKKRS